MTKLPDGIRFIEQKVICGLKRSHLAVFIYASNEPKSVLARDLGDCRDNLRNSRSVFLIVFKNDSICM